MSTWGACLLAQGASFGELFVAAILGALCTLGVENVRDHGRTRKFVLWWLSRCEAELNQIEPFYREGEAEWTAAMARLRALPQGTMLVFDWPKLRSTCQHLPRLEPFLVEHAPSIGAAALPLLCEIDARMAHIQERDDWLRDFVFHSCPTEHRRENLIEATHVVHQTYVQLLALLRENRAALADVGSLVGAPPF